MPTYTFKKADGSTTRRRLSFEEYELVRAGTIKFSDDTGEVLELIFDPTGMGFVLKDGPSGGWMSKANKENGFRAGRSATMARRERDHVFKSRLIPNLQGQEAGNWRDVQEEVRRVSGDAAASTYDAHVAKDTSG